MILHVTVFVCGARAMSGDTGIYIVLGLCLTVTICGISEGMRSTERRHFSYLFILASLQQPCTQVGLRIVA